MATQPTVGASTGTWGAEQNAFTGTSLDPATGKVKNEALQVADTAPIADAALANKKYVDDSVSLRAWVNFDGDTGNVADSFNVTSVTRTGAGKYTIVWDTNFADANYVISGMVADVGLGGWVGGDGDTPLSAGQALIRTVSTGHSEVDFNLVTVMAVGNQ